MIAFEEFCNGRGRLDERMGRDGAGLSALSKKLHKPKPDFSCLAVGRGELDGWRDEYLRSRKEARNDALEPVTHRNLLQRVFLPPLPDLKESLGDIKELDGFAEVIKSKYKFRDGQIEKIESYNGVDVYIALPPDDFIKNEVIQDMHKGGYFCNYCESDAGGYYLQFEPYLPNEVSADIRSRCRYLYHYTPFENVESIKSSGLLPYNKNIYLKYPQGRAYMSIFEDERLAIVLRQEGGFGEHYALFRIDVQKIPIETGLYYDAMAPGSVFSVRVIPASCVGLYREGRLTERGFQVIKEW